MIWHHWSTVKSIFIPCHSIPFHSVLFILNLQYSVFFHKINVCIFVKRFAVFHHQNKMTTLNLPIFKDLNPDDLDHETTIVESCCMNCFKNVSEIIISNLIRRIYIAAIFTTLTQGNTRLLLTKIPFYKEVVLMSFSCDHCGFANNEIQSGGEIAERGCRIELTIKNTDDLNRKIVKSDQTSLRIVELDFEIPSQSQKGEITTLEGVIDRSVAGLAQDQPVRRIEHPDAAQQIDEFIERLERLKFVDTPFNIVLEDISGNCYVENPNAPHTDAACIVTHFTRTQDQDHQLGMYTQQELQQTEGPAPPCSSSGAASHEQQGKMLHKIEEDSWPLEELHGQVLQFQTLCPDCKSPCETNMKVTTIPHFKDVVIMATVCDVCGNKTNEVKSGGGIEAEGVKFEVKIDSRDDMSRDVLKV